MRNVPKIIRLMKWVNCIDCWRCNVAIKAMTIGVSITCALDSHGRNHFFKILNGLLRSPLKSDWIPLVHVNNSLAAVYGGSPLYFLSFSEQEYPVCTFRVRIFKGSIFLRHKSISPWLQTFTTKPPLPKSSPFWQYDAYTSLTRLLRSAYMSEIPIKDW